MNIAAIVVVVVVTISSNSSLQIDVEGIGCS